MPPDAGNSYFMRAPWGTPPQEGTFVRMRRDRRVYEVMGSSLVGGHEVLTLRHVSLRTGETTTLFSPRSLVEEVLLRRPSEEEEGRRYERVVLRRELPGGHPTGQ